MELEIGIERKVMLKIRKDIKKKEKGIKNKKQDSNESCLCHCYFVSFLAMLALLLKRSILPAA